MADNVETLDDDDHVVTIQGCQVFGYDLSPQCALVPTLLTGVAHPLALPLARLVHGAVGPDAAEPAQLRACQQRHGGDRAAVVVVRDGLYHPRRAIIL